MSAVKKVSTIIESSINADQTITLQNVQPRCRTSLRKYVKETFVFEPLKFYYALLYVRTLRKLLLF